MTWAHEPLVVVIGNLLFMEHDDKLTIFIVSSIKLNDKRAKPTRKTYKRRRCAHLPTKAVLDP